MKRATSPQKRQARNPGKDGLGMWTRLHQKRQGMLRRFEQYASLTIPKVCLPDNTDQNSQSIGHDWTSVGAQAVNHLTNKIMLALFRPGMPFFRLDANPELKTQLAKLQVTDEMLRESLVGGEQAALQVLDQMAVRPKLNEAVRHLVVVGNVALDFTEQGAPRVIGVKNYVVKRAISGRIIRLLIHERVLWDELDEAIKAVVPRQGEQTRDYEYIDYVRWYEHKGNKWELTQHVAGEQLDSSFDHTYTEDTMPINALTWDLADEHDYGTGLVEDMAGDFGTLSTLSEAEIRGAVLASDYRWLADPAGVGDIEEFKRSTTGDVIVGKEKDLSLVSAQGMGANLELVSASADKVIRRIGQAFLLNSAITRDAERVTAEEIRMQAQELETSLGGVYSRLAVDLQMPIVYWLMKQIDVSIKGTKLIPTIVTGLAALSRNAEASALGLFLNDLATLGTLPPLVLQRLQLTPTISTLASAHGITPSKYVKSEETVQKENQEAMAAQNEAIASQEASKAGAQALAKQGTEQ